MSHPLVMIAAMVLPPQIRENEPRDSESSGAEARLRIVCDGMRVTFEQRQGCWSVADEAALRAESAVLAGFGATSRTLDRALGVCSALNAGVDLPAATKLNRRLAALDDACPTNFPRLSRDAWPALAHACAGLRTEGAWRWLLWMLPKRLEPCLGVEADEVPELWVAPGWYGWLYPRKHWEFDDSLVDELGPRFWQRIERHPDERIAQLRLAVDPDADLAALAALAAHSPHIEILDLVAVNPSTPLGVVEKIVKEWAGHSVWQAVTCQRAVQNPAVTDELMLVAAERAIEVKRRHRERYPTPRLLSLKWECNDIVAWAASNPKAPNVLLGRWSAIGVRPRLQASDLRFRVHQTPKGDFPTTLLESATRELSRPDVRHAAALKAIARHPNATASVRRQLANSENIGVRAAVAHSPATPLDLLAHLSNDPIAKVRAATAENPATPLTALQRLALDRIESVRVNAEALLKVARCTGQHSQATGESR